MNRLLPALALLAVTALTSALLLFYLYPTAHQGTAVAPPVEPPKLTQEKASAFARLALKGIRRVSQQARPRLQ